MPPPSALRAALVPPLAGPARGECECDFTEAGLGAQRERAGAGPRGQEAPSGFRIAQQDGAGGPGGRGSRADGKEPPPRHLLAGPGRSLPKLTKPTSLGRTPTQL